MEKGRLYLKWEHRFDCSICGIKGLAVFSGVYFLLATTRVQMLDKKELLHNSYFLLLFFLLPPPVPIWSFQLKFAKYNRSGRWQIQPCIFLLPIFIAVNLSRRKNWLSYGWFGHLLNCPCNMSWWDIALFLLVQTHLVINSTWLASYSTGSFGCKCSISSHMATDSTVWERFLWWLPVLFLFHQYIKAFAVTRLSLLPSCAKPRSLGGRLFLSSLFV